MSTQCKCHGVSGSCSVKTCWRSLADMHTVAERIYQKYVVAVQVRSRRISKQRRLSPVAHTGRANFSDDDLLFYTQSPDYCHAEPLLGSSGTTNRYTSTLSTCILITLTVIITTNGSTVSKRSTYLPAAINFSSEVQRSRSNVTVNHVLGSP